MSEPLKAGIVRVSLPLLGELLHMPEGHRIVAVHQAPDLSDTIDLRVEGPLMPSAYPYHALTRVHLEVTVTEDGTMVRERKYVGKFSS